MRIVVLFVFVCMCLCNSFSQNSQKSLKQILEATKSNNDIVVEGYYVDNSSFMVTRSSDGTIQENTRYAVYEYKYQKRLYTKTPEGKVDAPVFMKSEAQGKKHSRILFVNKDRSNDSQLVVEEFTTLGLTIVKDSVEYFEPINGMVSSVAVDCLREFLFEKGVMPQIKQDTVSLN